MDVMLGWIDGVPWWVVMLAVLTLGLAPFFPEPHIWEKLRLLANGTLTKPIDIFDLAFHAVPWVVALLKAVRSLVGG